MAAGCCQEAPESTLRSAPELPGSEGEWLLHLDGPILLTGDAEYRKMWVSVCSNGGGAGGGDRVLVECVAEQAGDGAQRGEDEQAMHSTD